MSSYCISLCRIKIKDHVVDGCLFKKIKRRSTQEQCENTWIIPWVDVLTGIFT